MNINKYVEKVRHNDMSGLLLMARNGEQTSELGYGAHSSPVNTIREFFMTKN